MYIQKRNIGVNVLLSIVTCGIYGLYWMYTLNEDTNYITRNKADFSGGMVILLNIVTCGIFGVYWAYRQGEKLDKYFATRRGGVVSTENLSMLYLLLAICSYFTGFTTLVAYALMQDKLNRIIEEDGTGQYAGDWVNTDFNSGSGFANNGSDGFTDNGNTNWTNPDNGSSNSNSDWTGQGASREYQSRDKSSDFDMIVEFKDDEE